MRARVEMRMIDEEGRITIVTNMSDSAFREFLLSGKEAPAYTRTMRETEHPKYGRVLTQFEGTLNMSSKNKWYITHRDDDVIMLSSTLEEAMKAHDKLMK